MAVPRAPAIPGAGSQLRRRRIPCSLFTSFILISFQSRVIGLHPIMRPTSIYIRTTPSERSDTYIHLDRLSLSAMRTSRESLSLSRALLPMPEIIYFLIETVAVDCRYYLLQKCNSTAISSYWVSMFSERACMWKGNKVAGKAENISTGSFFLRDENN
ncbi:hypothetical protein Trydic_g20090 [Trypoxylus dichotomus]